MHSFIHTNKHTDIQTYKFTNIQTYKHINRQTLRILYMLGFFSRSFTRRLPAITRLQLYITEHRCEDDEVNHDDDNQLLLLL